MKSKGDVPMKSATNIIVGFGKAGKTLAFKFAQKGESVILIEENEWNYGGTCINIGCIPSKFLYTRAEWMLPYKQAVLDKKATIEGLRVKNFHKVADQVQAIVLNGKAHFLDSKTLEVVYANGETDKVTGDRIFINTGAIPVIPDIPGVDQPHVMTTEDIMNLEELPEHLVIIGGGYIALEFATTYAGFGSEVHILVRGDTFAPQLERQAAQAVQEALEATGVTIHLNTQATEILSDRVVLNDGSELPAEAVLLATGRKPNIAGLNLEVVGIETDDHGAIKVDQQLKTNVPNIWALGDVHGGPQHTYLSLDDSRIIWSQLFGNGQKTLAEQALVPSVVFTNPPLATIGLNGETATAQGIAHRVGQIPVGGLPKAHILGNTRGYMKALVGEDDQILGATLFAVEAHETINIVAIAMQNHLPYQILRDQIFSHPTMAEGLNDVFDI
jgi:pyruvate/2-oxoglutarate dehydrogenase complex dihydrolipoamide dehydrogenase (E3) component